MMKVQSPRDLHLLLRFLKFSWIIMSAAGNVKPQGKYYQNRIDRIGFKYCSLWGRPWHLLPSPDCLVHPDGGGHLALLPLLCCEGCAGTWVSQQGRNIRSDLSRSMREQLYSALACSSQEVLVAQESSLSFLVWMSLRRLIWGLRLLMFLLKRYWVSIVSYL